MTAKSYITLGVVGILYVIMTATAVLSPHGTDFTPSGRKKDPSHVTYTTPLTGIKDTLTMKNASDVEVVLPLEGMPVFKATKVSVSIDGNKTMFKAVEFKTLFTWSGFKNPGEDVAVTDAFGKALTLALSDMCTKENCYVCYADESGKALDVDTYGRFCIVVASGDNSGFYTHITDISVG